MTAIEFVKGYSNSVTDFSLDHNPLYGDTVWLGTDTRKILIYLATNPEQEKQITVCPVPGVITQILYHMDCVYVSLTNSTLLIFRRNLEGHWQLKDPIILSLGNSEPITSLLPINTNVYAGCGRKVWVIHGVTSEILKTFDVQQGQPGTNQSINLMAHSGIGFWVALKNSSIICLYHTETFKHLQDINIASNVLRVTSSQRDCVNNNSSVFVTALEASKGLLWVGTNVGIALTIPLPRLEGVPIISGGVSISYHAHFGPITFLLPLLPKTYHRNLPVAGTTMEPKADDQPSSSTTLNDSDTSKVSNESFDHDSMGTLDSQHSIRRKLEKQTSLDIPNTNSITAKLRAQLANSPVALRRRRFKDLSESRLSKTLPRGLGANSFFSTSINSSNSSGNGSELSNVYGLYKDLIYVKEDDETHQGNLIDSSYEVLRKSDPELAVIQGKVSTLDRRLKMKVSRPRSLDLSNWSVDSRSSSLCTSSGSEESMALRHTLFSGRSVSRNSSSASHKTQSELTNICENGVCSLNSNEINDMSCRNSQASTVTVQSESMPPPPNVSATLKRKKNTKNTAANDNGGPRTVITLMGGRGYINWKSIWGASNERGGRGSLSIAPLSVPPNANDAHIVIWEKKL